MKRKTKIFLIILIIMINTIVYGDIGIEKNLRSYILADVESGQILEEFNIDEVIEIASISKLMSYLVIMDEISKGKASLEDNIVIDKDTTKVKGSSFKLKVGEEFKLEELLEAALVVSGNDATYALAKHISGTEEEFVILMNEKAKEIGLENAIFYNSTGLPVVEKDFQNMMTTKEIFKLSQYIIKNHPEILGISKKPAIEITSRDFYQRNTNPLLMKIDSVDGLKTGFTNKAGWCYVSTFNTIGRKGISKDLRLVSIVMGASGMEERNHLGEVLVQYGLNNYCYKVFLDEDIALASLEFPKGDNTQAEVYAESGFSRLIKNDEDIVLKIEIDENIDLPVDKDSIVGKAAIEKDGQIIFQTNILINQDIKKAKLYVLIQRFIQEVFNSVIIYWEQFFSLLIKNPSS